MGSRDQFGAQFASTVVATRVLHEKIGAVDYPATQLVLKGSCAGVSKVVYLLRLNGDELEDAELESLGGIQCASLAHTLHVVIGDLAYTQATAGKRRQAWVYEPPRSSRNLHSLFRA